MTRVMFDGVNPDVVPAGADLYAGYVDGAWPSFHQLALDHPAALHVPIAVFATDDATVLDVETGDATPAEAVGWAQRQRARGQIPTVYCNAATWPAVREAFAGTTPPYYWIADYDGDPSIPPGAVAKQYQGGMTATHDVSSVRDYWPGVDPAPAPAPPIANGVDPMFQMITAPAARAQLLLDGAHVYILDVPNRDAYRALGVPLTEKAQDVWETLYARGEALPHPPPPAPAAAPTN